MNATITQQVLFDYNALDTESRVKLQQLERELKDDHHTVDRLVGETLDKMWHIGSKYHEVQLLLRSRATNNFQTWFTATHAADNGGLLRKAYRCINIYQNVRRDNLSLLADTGKSTVYALASKSTPDSARAEILKRLGAGEKLGANDIVEIIESAKDAEMPMMLPMVIEEVAIKQEFVHAELSSDSTPRTPDVSAGRHETMQPVGKPHFTSGQLNATHVIGDKPTPGPAAQWLEKQKAVAPPPSPAPKAESPTAAPPPPPPPPPLAAKPVSELAKVGYGDEAEDDEDEDDGPIELTPLAPPPPPASAIPLPPPPPLVVRSQIDIAVEFSKLSAEKQFEVAYLMLTKMTKQQVKELFIKYQTQGEK